MVEKWEEKFKTKKQQQLLLLELVLERGYAF